MKIHSFVAVFLTGILISTSLFAKNHKGKHDHHKMKGMFQELNLTEEQKGKVKAIHEKHLPEMKKLRDAKKSALEAFKTAINNNASDAELKAKHEALHKAKDAMMLKKFDKRLEIRGLLTDDQKAKFKASMLKHIEKHHKQMSDDNDEMME